MRATHIAMVLPILFASHYARAGEESDTSSTHVQAGIDLESRYVRRGFDLNGGQPVLQPLLRLELPFGLSFESLGSIGFGKSAALNEIDFSLAYTSPLVPDRLDLTVEFASYHYLPTDANFVLTGSSEYANAQEFILRLETSDLPINLGLEYGRGIGGKEGDDIRGNYGALSFFREFDVGLGELNLACSATYLDEYEIPHKVTALTLRSSLGLDWGEMTIEPAITFNYLPSPGVLNGNDEHYIVTVGLEVSHEF